MNTLFVISGPSGVGKGTLVKRIGKEMPELAVSVSCTTREPRKGEVNGREYHFMKREEFERRIREGDFLEYDEHFGNYYGTPKSFVIEAVKRKSVVLEIDVVGALNAKEALKDSVENIVLIFVDPPDLKTLIARLKGRSSESEEELNARLARVEYELSLKDQYDYILVNDDLSAATARLKEMIQKETEKQERR